MKILHTWLDLDVGPADVFLNLIKIYQKNNEVFRFIFGIANFW